LIIEEEGEDSSEAFDEMEIRDHSNSSIVRCFDPSTMQRLGDVVAYTQEEVRRFMI